VAVGLAALFAFGAGEWVREAVRKPYVIHGYMYSTGLRPDETSQIAEGGGILANAKWTENDIATPNASVGEDLFRVACRSCHTLDGYNGLREPLQGLDEEYLFELTGRLDVLRGQMPPFPGTEVERRALAKYLSAESGEKTWSGGRDVFEKRCGFCHTKEGFQPLYESLQGYTREDVVDVLPLLGDMTDEMAPWSGTDEESALLADYLVSWYANGAKVTGGEN
jgi:mono/diheme cytochrome c family protein